MEHVAALERRQDEKLAQPIESKPLKSSAYGKSRQQPPIRQGVVILEQDTDIGSTRYLFSASIVRAQSGKELKLDDPVAPGFALAAKTEADFQMNKSLSEDLEKIGARLVSLVSLVTLASLKHSLGRFDRLFEAHKAAIFRPGRLVCRHITENHD